MATDKFIKADHSCIADASVEETLFGFRCLDALGLESPSLGACQQARLLDLSTEALVQRVRVEGSSFKVYTSAGSTR